MRWRRLALLAFVLATAGCGERAEPVGRTVSPYPVTVRGAGDAVVLRARARRIVALDPGATEILAELGARERLVGVPSGVEPPRFYAGLPAGARRVVSPGGQVDVDTIVELEPDVVVTTREIDPTDAVAAAREAGARLYLHPDRSLRDVERGTIELGFIVGEPTRSRQLVASIRRRAAETETRIAGRVPVRVFVDTGFLTTVPERSLVADLVRRGGGVSVVTGEAAAQIFEPCDVARLRPRVVLRVVEEPRLKRPSLRSFRRCRAGGHAVRRIVDLPASLVAQASPDVGEAVAAIARKLHPDAFR